MKWQGNLKSNLSSWCGSCSAVGKTYGELKQYCNTCCHIQRSEKGVKQGHVRTNENGGLGMNKEHYSCMFLGYFNIFLWRGNIM